MAKKQEATLSLIIKTAGEKALSGIDKIFSKITFTAGDVVNGIRALASSFIDLAQKGAKFQDVSRSFRALAQSQGQDADAMLAKMKELSRGTISDLDLMQQANNALLLGLPVDRFGEMLTIARSASKATGQSMEFMLQSIVTGLGRGSKLMLDNLGILVDQTSANKEYAAAMGIVGRELTEAERKQAFINAALAAGKKNADDAGDSSESLSDKFQRLKANSENLATVIGSSLSTSMSSFVDLTNKAIEATTKLFSKPTTQDLETRLDTLQKKLSTLNDEFEGVNQKGLRAIFTRAKGVVQAEIFATETAIEQIQVQLSARRAAAEEERKIEQQKLERKKEIDQQRAELEEIRLVEDEIRKEEEKERERLFAESLKNIDLEQTFDRLDQKIIAEQDHTKKLELIRQRDLLKQKAINDQKKKEETALHQFKQFLASEEVRTAQSVFAQISTLSSSKNKALAALGKAAAIANITINTAQGVSAAFALGPILGPILAPIVIAAGVAQAAKVSGVQLADGGIVKARQGGTQAIIGEGREDEAVVPLGDSGLFGGTTINFHGPVLGDQAQAREFAIRIDQELLKLRRGNESVAFDSDVI